MNAVTSEANKHNDAMKGQMQIENGTRLFHDREWGIDRVPPIRAEGVACCSGGWVGATSYTKR